MKHNSNDNMDDSTINMHILSIQNVFYSITISEQIHFANYFIHKLILVHTLVNLDWKRIFLIEA